MKTLARSCDVTLDKKNLLYTSGFGVYRISDSKRIQKFWRADSIKLWIRMPDTKKKLRIKKFPDTFKRGLNEGVSFAPIYKEILKTVEDDV